MEMIIQFILSVGILVRCKGGGAMPTENEIESAGIMAKDLRILDSEGKCIDIQKSWGLMGLLKYFFRYFTSFHRKQRNLNSDVWVSNAFSINISRLRTRACQQLITVTARQKCAGVGLGVAEVAPASEAQREGQRCL